MNYSLEFVIFIKDKGKVHLDEKEQFGNCIHTSKFKFSLVCPFMRAIFEGVSVRIVKVCNNFEGVCKNFEGVCKNFEGV